FALIAGLKDDPFVPQSFQERLHRAMVLGRGGPDESVIGDLEGFPGLLEFGGNLIAVGLGVAVMGRGRLRDLGPVFVGPGEAAHFPAVAPIPAGQDIAGDRRISVADVRHIVDVIDRGGDEEVAVAHATGRARRLAARRKSRWSYTKPGCTFWRSW